MKFFKKKSKREKKKLKKLQKEKRIIKREKIKEKIKKFDLSEIFGGMAVGVANIIPGVSGGTMLVIFNLFDKLMYAISDVFKRKTDTRKQSIILILKVLIGAGIGIILFAKLIGLALEHIEAETIFWFMGLILFSIPIVINQEMKNEKFKIIPFAIAFISIIILQYLKSKSTSGDLDETINLIHYLLLVLYGIIGGVTMIFPGVSGSMVLLVLGKYELIRNYIDKVTTFDMEVLLSLTLFGIGALLGIVLSAKLTSSLLKKHKSGTMSAILGFIIASALILPFNIENKVSLETPTLCAIIASFVLGGIVIYYINRLQEKRLQ